MVTLAALQHVIVGVFGLILGSIVLVQTVAMEGRFELVVFDDLEAAVSKTEHFLVTDEGLRFGVVFGDPGAAIPPGRVRVSGNRIFNVIYLVSSNPPYVEPVNKSSAAGDEGDSAAASVPKKVAVILIKFRNDASEPISHDQARGVTFTNPASVSDYYEEVSFGQRHLEGAHRLDGDVYGYYTIPYDNTGCEWSTWGSSARSMAAADGFDVADFDNVIHVFNQSGCWFSGMAYITGTDPLPKYSFIARAGAYNLRVVAHELGHNYGFHHANWYRCRDASGAGVTLSEDCTSLEYGDQFDVMGGARQYHLSNRNKWSEGWFESARLRTISAAGTYTLDLYPVEFPVTGLQAIRIPGGGTGYYYYLEFRRPFGFDNFSSTSPAVNGVSVRRSQRTEFIDKTHILDSTPGTNTPSDAPFPEGTTFSDPASGVEVRVLDVTSEKASVQIAFTPMDHAPTAEAGPSHPLRIGRPHTHNGGHAKDADGDLDSAHWALVACPSICPAVGNATSPLSGGSASVPGPTFTPTVPGRYVLELTVTDRSGHEGRDRVEETARISLSCAPLGIGRS